MLFLWKHHIHVSNAKTFCDRQWQSVLKGQLVNNIEGETVRKWDEAVRRLYCVTILISSCFCAVFPSVSMTESSLHKLRRATSQRRISSTVWLHLMHTKRTILLNMRMQKYCQLCNRTSMAIWTTGANAQEKQHFRSTISSTLLNTRHRFNCYKTRYPVGQSISNYLCQ